MSGDEVRFRVKQVGGVALNLALFAALLFIPAGTVYWPRAWVFLAVVLVAAGLSIGVISEDLLDERYGAPLQPGQPLADKVVLVAFIVSFFVTMAAIPLDVFRFHWLSPPGPIVSSIGLILFAAGWWLVISAMLANSFAAPVVKLQTERRQRVIESGPYRMVRHPMYLGVVPLLIGAALWLGSYAAAIIALIPIALIVTRIPIEERFLRRELPGYEEYARHTRFRLIPYVW